MASVRTETRAAILCGGRGERLKPLTDYFQKTMIPIGPKKLPLLAYILKLVTHHGINDVTLLTGYRSEDIQHYFGDGSQLGVKLSYSEDRKDLKGSLNAVANAMGNGAIPSCDELLIYYGDVLTDLDITSLVSTHRAMKADATLVLARGYTLPVGTAEVTKGGLVKSFKEKPDLDLTVTTGCMVLGPRGMALIESTAGPRNTDLMTHFLPQLLRARGRVAAFYTSKEWYDVGTVSSFEKLNREIGRHPLSYLV
jgi:mannose-1-phosphate guanylyltransferase